MGTQTRLLALATTALLFLAGCGQGSGQQGYLAHPDADSVQFLQVTRNGSGLTGNLQSTGIAPTDSTTVMTFNAAFTGTVDGSQLTLTFPAGLGFATALSGNLSGNHIQLSIPQVDGTLATEDFAPSDTNAYNAGVRALQQRAAQALADQQQAAAAALAAQEAAVAAAQAAHQAAEARAALDQAISAVKADLTSLSQDASETGGPVGSAGTDLKTTQQDVNTTYSDLQKVQQEGSGSGTCSYDASVVSYDASVVLYDEGVVEYDQSSETYFANNVTGAITQVATDFGSLTQAQRAATGYAPSEIPSQHTVNLATSHAKAAVASAHNAIATDVGKAKGMVTLANQYVTDATAVCG